MNHIYLITAILSIVSLIDATVHIQTNSQSHVFTSVTMHFFDKENNEFKSEYDLNVSSIFIHGQSEGSPSGKIVFLPRQYGIDDAARLYQGQGAAGLIMDSGENRPGRSNYWMSRPRTPVSLPTAEIDEASWQTVVNEINQEEEILWVHMVSTAEELNPYYYKIRSVTLFEMIFSGSFFGILLIISILLLVREVMEDGEVRIQVKNILLIMLIFANIYRFCTVVFDPLGAGRIIHWIVPVFEHIINVPLMVICELLVSLYWFDSMTLALKDEKILGSTKIPFIVIIVLFVISILVMGIIAFVNPVSFQRAITVLGAIYALSLLVLAIFHLVVSIRLLTLLEKIKKRARIKRNSKVFVIKIAMISIIDFIFIVTILWVAVLHIPDAPITPALLQGFILQTIAGIHSIVILSLFQWRATSSTSMGSSVKSAKTKNQSIKTETKQPDPQSEVSSTKESSETVQATESSN